MKVGEDMRDWFISGDDHRWTIKLDGRDFGGHLDATFWARNATLARRAVGVLDKVPTVGALPLWFSGKLRILRAMHTPAALHGVEASHISQASLKRLRAAYVRAVTSGSMHLANPGTVLSRLGGPTGCDPGCHVVWCRFRMLRRYMAYNAGVWDLLRVYGLLRAVCTGAPGHGPIHVLLHGVAESDFSWDPAACVWTWVASSLPDC